MEAFLLMLALSFAIFAPLIVSRAPDIADFHSNFAGKPLQSSNSRAISGWKSLP
jgi:hypothetical protein